MPLYRHTCAGCRAETEDLLGLRDPVPEHCGAPMVRIMPTRVVGRCAPDSDGAHAGSGFAAPRAAPGRTMTTDDGTRFDLLGDEPERHHLDNTPATLTDASDPNVIPEPANQGVFALPYESCRPAQKEERWRDTRAALVAHHRGLEPHAPPGKAETAAKTIVERAAAETP